MFSFADKTSLLPGYKICMSGSSKDILVTDMRRNEKSLK